MLIQALVRRGVYVCDIARQLGVHPKTVSGALARGSALAVGRPWRRWPATPCVLFRSSASVSHCRHCLRFVEGFAWYAMRASGNATMGS